MSDGFFDALIQITRERKVDRETLLEALSFSLRSAVRRKHGSEAVVDVDILAEKGEIEVHLIKRVVTEEDLINEDQEFTVDEAEEYVDDPEPGDVLRIPLDVAEFGRNAILIAKQVLVQGVRDAERENVFNEYSDRVGEIITGTVQQIDRGSILVNLGRTEALLPWREQIRRERFHQSESLKGLVLEVHRESKGPQIILSRTHPDFLARLFEQEIPEVYEGLVELKAIAREPGWRSKVAVQSHDDRVDPVGACVGMRGARVMAIVKELSGERIDIVPWDEDSASFVSRALSPAQVSSIKVTSWEGRSMQVVVEADQLSLAIGREGQNVRLASRLTGWSIDLITTDLMRLRSRAEDEFSLGLTDLEGVSDKLAEVMIEGGIEKVEHLINVGLGGLLDLPGIGEKKAESLLENAGLALENVEVQRKEFMEREQVILDEERLQREKLFDGDQDEGASEESEPKSKSVPKLTFSDVEDDEDEESSEAPEPEDEIVVEDGEAESKPLAESADDA
jgi:transcription termination/antitermination protein NusA